MTADLELNNADIVFERLSPTPMKQLRRLLLTRLRTGPFLCLISLAQSWSRLVIAIVPVCRKRTACSGSPAYLVDTVGKSPATVTPSGSSHNYFFAGRIIAQSGQNVFTLNISVALRANTLPDLSWTINYDEDVIGTASQYITQVVLFVKETSPASFILAVEVHNTIFGTLTADLLDFFARTQADLADISEQHDGRQRNHGSAYWAIRRISSPKQLRWITLTSLSSTKMFSSPAQRIMLSGTSRKID